VTTSGPWTSSSRDETIRPSESGSVNDGATSPALSARSGAAGDQFVDSTVQACHDGRRGEVGFEVALQFVELGLKGHAASPVDHGRYHRHARQIDFSIRRD
jgi:hypothetical protein